MVADADAQRYIVHELAAYMGCPVVLTNQTTPAPPYPYVSYTILTVVAAKGGTYGFTRGIYLQPMEQTWSLTTHTDNPTDSGTLGMRLYDFFARAGRAALFRENIAVANVGSVTCRDNLLTVQFEYRTGADVTLRLMHRLGTCEGEITREKLNAHSRGFKRRILANKHHTDRKDSDNT